MSWYACSVFLIILSDVFFGKDLIILESKQSSRFVLLCSAACSATGTSFSVFTD